MKWLTHNAIQKKSKTKKGALKISIEHYQQIVKATLRELIDGFEYYEISMGACFCGLCMHYLDREHTRRTCESCPLRDPKREKYGGMCCQEWANAHMAFYALKMLPDRKNLLEVRKLSKILIKKMQSSL